LEGILKLFPLGILLFTGYYIYNASFKMLRLIKLYVIYMNITNKSHCSTYVNNNNIWKINIIKIIIYYYLKLTKIVQRTTHYW